MLMLGPLQQRVTWAEAGIWLELIPLPDDKEQEFVRQTVVEERDDKGKLINVRRDVTKFAQLVGRYCIKGWGGVVNAQKDSVPCAPEAIDDFMRIDVAQEFVFAKVKGLALYLADEVDAAKNA